MGRWGTIVGERLRWEGQTLRRTSRSRRASTSASLMRKLKNTSGGMTGHGCLLLRDHEAVGQGSGEDVQIGELPGSCHKEVREARGSDKGGTRSGGYLTSGVQIIIY